MKRLIVAIGVLSISLMAVGSASAQDVVVSGTVVDATDAVIPGATVTAVLVASGNTTTVVTNGAGEYRFGALRPGIYNIIVELVGFSTVTHESVELLVGQRAAIDFQLVLSEIQETITVTGESPLIDIQQSELGGNITARQVEALPLNGRNWMQLTMLAPGSRVNAVEDSPFGNLAGAYQLNLDGQQVTSTQTFSTFGQPRFSRDAIAELEVVTSRFDATQGRSKGIQVNAISKSGTNTYSGMVSGFFRHDSLIAEDLVLGRVLDYSNQQVSTTFGGPILENKVHFFAYYETEREPHELAFNSPFPSFNITGIKATNRDHLAGFRLDWQLAPSMRLLFRGNGWSGKEPVENIRLNSGTSHPSTLNSKEVFTAQGFLSLVQTFGGTSVNEISGGLSLLHIDQDGIIPPAFPQIRLRGYTIGSPFFMPLREYQDTWSVRDDFTFLLGAHEFKLGGEVLLPVNFLYWPHYRSGILDATLGPPPDNLEELFPVWDDPTTWNLAPLSSITRQWIQSVGTYDVHCAGVSGFEVGTVAEDKCRRSKPQLAGWFQDNWQVTSDLTLNLGLRWDFAQDGLGNEVDLPPARSPTDQELSLFGPRLGFAYSLNERTVIRGGFGKYISGTADTLTHQTMINLAAVLPELFNDGRPDFASDPYNIAGGGRPPTVEEANASRRDFTGSAQSDEARTSYSYQTALGFQRQLGQTMAVQADYVYVAGRNEPNSRNINLTYDPVTGVNLPFSDVSTRPFPQFGRINVRFAELASNYHALEMAFTKRFSDRWQASATYTLSRTTDCDPSPVNDAFVVALDLGGECGLSAGGTLNAADQRHRAVVNGIYELPYDVQLSGLYFFGSGQRFSTSFGADLRDRGQRSGRLRPDGTISARNNFVGNPLHRVDMRVTKRLRFGDGATVDGIVEVFNLFNHANFGRYNTSEASAGFGTPRVLLATEYQPRTLQLAFRATF